MAFASILAKAMIGPNSFPASSKLLRNLRRAASLSMASSSAKRRVRILHPACRHQAWSGGVIAFDLLFLGGKDLRRFPLARRKEALTKLVTRSEVIQEAETFNDPIALLRAAGEHGLEGVVSKRKDLPYRSGRCSHWQKVKTAAWRAAHADRGERFKRGR